MTKKEAIKVIKANYPSGGYERLCEALEMAIKALEDSRWIPVTERLPEEDGRYLCTYQNDAYGDCIDFGMYEDGEWYVSGVTAWMPLPKPYEGSETDAEQL